MKRTILFILVLAASFAASAQVLYKLVDKKGKVTYAEKIPQGFDGQATRVDIDPNRNTATLPKPQGVDTETGKGSSGPVLSPRQQTEARKERRIEEAKKRLDEAKIALADAMNNPSDDDIMRLGNVRGGSRAVWSDQYKDRIANLEAQVIAAEDALARAEAD